MSLIFYIESQNIDNVLFLTGDTHWPFALSYDPDRDGEANFYEFGSSPLSAINLPPVDPPDPTFNPTVLYAEGEFQGTLFNFGHITVADDGELTFRVVDREGEEHYAITVDPILPEPEPEE
jgi:phosphodiesterase/alkaline phosphatase D-like protein